MKEWNIGGFVVWKEMDDGKIHQTYLNSDANRLTRKQIPIIKEIIENTSLNDNYISSTVIAKNLDRSEDAVKKMIERIQELKGWKDVIESGKAKGYRIKLLSESANCNNIVLDNSNNIGFEDTKTKVINEPYKTNQHSKKSPSNNDISPNSLTQNDNCDLKKTNDADQCIEKNCDNSELNNSVLESSEQLTLDNLIIKKELSWLQIPIGLVYIPRVKKKGPFLLDFWRFGHTAIYGAPGTGKTVLLKTMVTSLCKYNTPDDVSIYIIDCGGWSMSVFSAFPNVGGVVLDYEEDKIFNLTKMMFSEFDRRRKLFVENYTNSLISYRNKVNSAEPAVFIFVDNVTVLIDMYPGISILLNKIALEGIAYGIFLVFTARKKTENIKNLTSCMHTDIYFSDSKYSSTIFLPQRNGYGWPFIVKTGETNLRFSGEIQVAVYSNGDDYRQRENNIKKLASEYNANWKGQRPKAVQENKIDITRCRYRLLSANGNEIYLECGTHFIGKDMLRNSIGILDKLASSMYAIITVSEQHIWIQDYQSKSGIYVNDELLRPDCRTEIFDGDIIKIGNEEYRLKAISGFLSSPEEEYALVCGTHVVGKDLNLGDSNIIITASRGCVLIQDFDSTNGIFINDERLPLNDAVEINDGDRIRLGKEDYVFRSFRKPNLNIDPTIEHEQDINADHSSSRTKFDDSLFVCEFPPDGIKCIVGEEFKKTWTIRNVGNVVWHNRYMRCDTLPFHLTVTPQVVKMSDIKPGEEFTLEVKYKADDVGSYYSVWKAYDEDGNLVFPEKSGVYVTLVVVPKNTPSNNIIDKCITKKDFDSLEDSICFYFESGKTEPYKEYLENMPNTRKSVNELLKACSSYDLLEIYFKLLIDCNELLTKKERKRLLKKYKSIFSIPLPGEFE